ncbi:MULTISPECIES: glycoside hydrolase family 2 TIM barrel-domain containing protein [Sphingobium]|uniref:glycoside hydrolase family 2 TIM barrel-domain containing protein n=1 Tax=Sphingobium TaxID=165695 RepID=UPI001831ACDF|nr:MULTISPECIES: glycoside hydrolase family 2 TIM barrel-domain containing protein [Sphingobium]MCW2363007.1 beta-galactosidase [Sphingobium sp. B10D3B]MCW2400313.1 beta-galactosidase [Sphingobium sp. B10D7B]MCW2407291.1 beta-galactosidase [Sphingobium xanthum]
MRMMTSMALVLALAATSHASPSLARDAVSSSDQASEHVRTRMALADGWQFNLVGEAGPAAHDPKPENWKPVSVPHSWNRVGYYLSDPETHVNSAETVNKIQGVGWYQLTFTPAAANAGKRAFLEFDAASRTAEVWLNGVRLGEHRNPFGRFRLDATSVIRFGEPNSLYVKVDNTQPRLGNSTADVLPMTGDFFVRGGLYRPVSLVMTNPVHIDMLDHGGPGIYAATRSVESGRATIDLLARLRNDSASAQPVTIDAQLLDHRGKAVATWRETAQLAAGAVREMRGTLVVADPHLWNGTADPYLHTLRFEMRSATGELLDALDQPFGIRTLRLDPKEGFFLNGKRTPLVGVGLHQDNEAADWAMTPKDVAETVDIMRDMGANSLRLAHYQHGQPIHDLADRYGLILWDEIALVTAWTNARDQTEAPAGIRENARMQLQDLIKQNYNHASVAVWGIANEVDFGPGRPDFLGRPPEVLANPRPLLDELNALAKSVDPLRPVVLAQCCEGRGMPDVPPVAESVDAVGANRYYGWYYGEPDQLGAHLDELRAKRPDQPISISEIGAGGAANMASDDPLGGPIESAGRTQPEAFFSWYHEQSWKVLKDRRDLWGIWLWNGFDFGSTVRREGDAQDINTKGIVTYDRKIRKDIFYFYRANWSDKPTVHINGRRYVDRAYPVTDIRVYSNAPETLLTVNGRTLGGLKDCPDSVCVWPAVRLKQGGNVIEARGVFPSGPVMDRIDWTVAPAQARSFRIDSGALVAARADVQFGSDDFFVGGTAGTTDQPGGRGRQAVVAEISGTDRRDVVASFRQGEDFQYRIPAANGRYRVTLSFVEPDKGVGERRFSVTANGRPVLQAYDIRARAGAVRTAVRETFDVDVTGQMLTLQFKASVGEAVVSAIEVEPVGN